MSAPGERGDGVARPRHERATITPEAVALDLATATVGSRGAAYLLDLSIMAAIATLFGVSTSVLQGVTGGGLPGWVGVAVIVVAGFVLLVGYPAGFETLWHGRTPGKAALGLRVVTREGGPVTARHGLIRAVFALVELLGTFGAPAVVTALLNARGQRLGDLAAGTVVLRERSAHPPVAATEFTPPRALAGYVAALDVSRLDPADYRAVRSLLLRADQLAREARDRLATRLATRVGEQVRPAAPSGVQPLDYLACVAAAYQRRHATATASSSHAMSPPAPPAAPERAGEATPADATPPRPDSGRFRPPP